MISNFRVSFLAAVVVVCLATTRVALCFQQQQQQQQTRITATPSTIAEQQQRKNEAQVDNSVRHSHQFRFAQQSTRLHTTPSGRRACDPCENQEHRQRQRHGKNEQKNVNKNNWNDMKEEEEEETDDDLLLDRREAAFALVGTLWATTSLLPTALLFPEAAHAAYGQDANLLLPNPMESTSVRSCQQTNDAWSKRWAGSRECLVFEGDRDKFLYQGIIIDQQELLSRVEQASQVLETLPTLIQQKKWSQVNGVLTGPLGDLVRTLNQLSKDDESGLSLKPKVTTFKNDLYAISGAIQTKQGGDKALQFHAAATKDLIAFLKAL